MTDAELIDMLRNNVGVSEVACRAAKAAADRIEQLIAEKNAATAAAFEVAARECDYYAKSWDDLNINGSSISVIASAIRADLAAVPAQVRVKPLVWGTFGKECFRAETVLGHYEVMWGFHNGQTSLDIPAPRRSHVWHPSVEAAKTAAQADYEARLLSALEPQPAPDALHRLIAEAVESAAETAAQFVHNRLYEANMPACSYHSRDIKAAILALIGEKK